MPQCPCGFSPAAAACPAHHHRLGPLSRNQNSRPADHPATGGSPAWRQHSRWLDCQTDSLRRPYHLPALCEGVRAQPTPLRSSQTQRPWLGGSRGPPLRLPPHSKRRSGGAPVRVLPQPPLPPSVHHPLSPTTPPST